MKDSPIQATGWLVVDTFRQMAILWVLLAISLIRSGPRRSGVSGSVLAATRPTSLRRDIEAEAKSWNGQITVAGGTLSSAFWRIKLDRRMRAARFVLNWFWRAACRYLGPDVGTIWTARFCRHSQPARSACFAPPRWVLLLRSFWGCWPSWRLFRAVRHWAGRPGCEPVSGIRPTCCRFRCCCCTFRSSSFLVCWPSARGTVVCVFGSLVF